MSRPSMLLRVLIALMLVLNGIGGTAASARMLVEHEALAVHRSVATEQVAMPPCHEAMAAMGHQMPTPPGATASSDDPDCCSGDQCACECIQHCCGVPVPALADIASGPASTAVHPLSDGHPEPVRPRLIRPPIG